MPTTRELSWTVIFLLAWIPAMGGCSNGTDSDADADTDTDNSRCPPGYHEFEGECVPDVICADCDADNDGYPEELDCDDGDPMTYPGTADGCAESCEGGWRTCLDDGTWSPCECSPLCEASGSGRCFYVQADLGSDTNDGSFASPWRTYLNIVSYYSPGDAPASAVDLGPGDVVYFLDGTYDATYPYSDGQKAFFVRNVHGAAGEPITLRAYPGHRPIITNDQSLPGIVLQSSSYFVVDGFEVRDTFGKGVFIGETTDAELRRLEVHDVSGYNASNVAGIRFNFGVRIDLHHSIVHDIRAIDQGDGRVGSWNVILFSGGDIRIHRNTFYATPLEPSSPPLKRGGVLYKHSATVEGSIFEVDHNVFQDLENLGVGSGTFSSRIHHNLFRGATVRFADFGGTTHNVDNIVSNNTFVYAEGLSLNPTDTYGPIGMTTYRRNIVVDDADYDGERGIVTIGTYNTDEIYELTVTAGNLTFSENCYFNATNTPKWNLFAAGGSWGDLGGIYDFEGWQGLGYDLDSIIVDPMLDQNHVPQAAECASYGWRAP